MRVAVPSYAAAVSHLFCIFPELSVSFFTTLLLHNNTWQLAVQPRPNCLCFRDCTPRDGCSFPLLVRGERKRLNVGGLTLFSVAANLLKLEGSQCLYVCVYMCRSKSAWGCVWAVSERHWSRMDEANLRIFISECGGNILNMFLLCQPPRYLLNLNLLLVDCRSIIVWCFRSLILQSHNNQLQFMDFENVDSYLSAE